jgi:hypothetical protein
MLSTILRGITIALLVTVLTLLTGIALSVLNLGSQSIIGLLDFGLLVSCLISGYWTAKASGKWWLGGIVGIGYVIVGTLLLALFLPIRGWGFIQVLAEGAAIGLVAGAVAAGGNKGTLWSGKSSTYRPSYAGYEPNSVSRRFDWDEEKDFNEWQETSITHGSESGEKSSDVEWPWDREKGKTTISTSSTDAGDSEPLVIGEPEFVRTHLWERNRLGLPGKEITGSKPWWEE